MSDLWTKIKLMLPASQNQLAFLAIKQEILERQQNALIEYLNVSSEEIDEISEKQRLERMNNA